MKYYLVYSLALWLSIWMPATAQTTYPTKPVKLMVGAGAGGGTDIIARMLSEKFSESLKGSFIVENKPGASNTIAADLTAKAQPDGHTLLVATNTGQAIAPHLIKLSFDPMKDLTPIGLVVTVPNVLVVGASVPANNIKELVALMKAKPEEFKYASSGVGSTQHIAGEGFDIAAGDNETADAAEFMPIIEKSQADRHAGAFGDVIETRFPVVGFASCSLRRHDKNEARRDAE